MDPLYADLGSLGGAAGATKAPRRNALISCLARALNVSTDQLLSDAPPTKRPAKAALGPRLERRLKQLEQLSPKSKQQLLNIIDTAIENEALKQRSSRCGQRSDRLDLRRTSMSRGIMKFQEIISRLTGFSTPIFGVQWNPPEPQRTVARA